ncbi:MAG TPA: hemerythrin domain-containing protein [Bryobacteraceae bacterium]|nr:hemerythrin domain-containing protein [Bryobacteraceae bacterium]
MQRHPSLVPLSHQHHNGLALCVLTRRSLAEDASPANVDRLARRAVDRYELELANHFEIEEQVLFPAIEEAVGKLDLIAELIAEHRRLETTIGELRAAPGADVLERLCALLSAHIRREENDLFQLAQARLPETALEALGQVIDAKAVRLCIS